MTLVGRAVGIVRANTLVSNIYAHQNLAVTKLNLWGIEHSSINLQRPIVNLNSGTTQIIRLAVLQLLVKIIVDK
jgi:hypothetical protein